MSGDLRFEQVERQVVSHYARREYAKSLAILDQAGPHLSGLWERIAYWRACLLARSGDPDGAVDTLAQAVEAGAWWSPRLFETEADFDSLWRHRGFDELLAVMDERRRQWAPAATGLFVDGTKGGWPFVGMHGRNQIFEIDAIHIAAAMGEGWEVAVPESAQRVASDGPVWDRAAAARNQVIALADDLWPERSFTVGGFSQGGRRALQIGLGSAGRVSGVLAVAPMLLRSREIAEVVESVGHPPWPLVALVAGSDDPAGQGVAAVAAHLRDEGVETIVHVADRAGHAWIDPPTEMLTELAKRAGG